MDPTQVIGQNNTLQANDKFSKNGFEGIPYLTVVEILAGHNSPETHITTFMDEGWHQVVSYRKLPLLYLYSIGLLYGCF